MNRSTERILTTHVGSLPEPAGLDREALRGPAVPGVISHATDGIEHPELVSQRIQRFAKRVGRENVIAGTDCGGRSHPQIAWAKLKSLAAGAKLASRALFH